MQPKKIFIIAIFLAVAALALAALTAAAPVYAQTGQGTPTPQTTQVVPTPTVDTSGISDDQVNDVARGLYCPVCSNVPLDVCGTQSCADWRELIRQKLAEGWSADRIKMYFLQLYGDQVLPVPPNPLIYIIPGVAILAAVVVTASKLLSWNSKPAAPGAPAGPLLPANDPYIARLEAELETRKKARR